MKNLLVAGLILLSGAAFAKDAESLRKVARTAFDAKDFPKAAVLYREAFEHDPLAWVAYNSACSYALAGDKESAFAWLAKAFDKGYLNASHLSKDSDLESLHSDARWLPMLEGLKEREARNELLFRSSALELPFADTVPLEKRVAGLALVWSEFKYNMIHEEAMERVDWDKTFLEYLPKVQAATSTAAYYGVLREMVLKLDDANSNVVFPMALRDEQEAGPPFQTRLVEERVFVDNIWDEALHNQGVTAGVEIISVDGVPMPQYLRNSTTWLSAMPEERRRLIYSANYTFMYGPRTQTAQVEFAAEDGKRFNIPVQRMAMRARNRRIERLENEIQVRKDGIAYIRVAKFDSAFVAEAKRRYADWRDTRALVIDVRQGDGYQFASYWMARCLLEKPFQSLPLISRQNRTADRLAGSNSLRFISAPETLDPEPACQYRKPVYLLTSEETDNAGEILARVMKREGRATVIGEPILGGATAMPVKLPGGGMAFYAAEMLAAADGSPERKSVQPDVAGHQSISDYRQGIDTVLQSTIARALKETRN